MKQQAQKPKPNTLEINYCLYHTRSRIVCLAWAALFLFIAIACVYEAYVGIRDTLELDYRNRKARRESNAAQTQVSVEQNK